MSPLYQVREVDDWNQVHYDAFLEQLFELAFRRLQVVDLSSVFEDVGMDLPEEPAA